MPHLTLGEERRILAHKVEVASSFWQQLRGLIGREIESDFALVIPNCRQVHTALVSYPIDVAFCKSHTDQNWEVVCVVTLPPWRLSPSIPDATFAIEMRAGKLAPYLQAGSPLQLTEMSGGF